ncbi:MAG: tripartite tricarboxylate transporter substrate binding protein [Burkholderiaceae bacterium]|jgi:tripartite-type tricarboxylate transporter receptor subunit TctC|nr:tripartite tricarboxylate transporter substrate binding protein [Burkholderiaceae bacterium]MCU0963522.1 tripartite tricarboxylate transporter substrate binding protein [Burkholderiaceae bacterium]
MKRRQSLALLLAGLGAAAGVRAQAFPSKPIRILVGYSAGGAVDIIARAIAQQLQANMGQPVIVENKPGAGTNIANRALIDSPPDGYTLMLAANALAANVSLYQPPPYDLLRDVTPVSLVGRVPVVLAVNAAFDHNTIARFIAAAKAAPKAVTYATPGNGSTPHLAMELFERAAGISMTHVPYKGGSQAITDLIGGHVQAVAVNALEVQPHVRSGKLRVLVVMTPKRSVIFPDVPTVAESGFPGFEAAVWYGVVAPAGLPAPVRERLHAEVQRALAADEVKNRLVSAGGEVLPGSIDQFAQLLNSERARYETLIRDAKIKPD